MMSMSLSARLSPRARTEQRGVRDVPRAPGGLVGAKRGDDGLAVHGGVLT
jgi:hypothetical protein